MTYWLAEVHSNGSVAAAAAAALLGVMDGWMKVHQKHAAVVVVIHEGGCPSQLRSQNTELVTT